jgi:hypothetical protein
MGRVKGSKQHEMVVVAYRPFYKAILFLVFIFSIVVLGWLIYEYGKNRGLELKVEVVREKDLISKQLAEARALIGEMKQQNLDLTLGGEIDNQANEEVRQTIENQRNQLAAQDEEISFYKGVMVPNAGAKGLRIERLDVSSNLAGKVTYSLLLTQVVEKRGYVQGGVQITLLGQNDGQEKALQLTELGRDRTEAIKFRFRYFQNIAGEVQLPKGFVPREFLVVAQSSEPIAQRLEKTFDWPLKGE